MEKWLETAAMEESPTNTDHTGILNSFSTALWLSMSHGICSASFPVGCYILLYKESELRIIGKRCDDNSHSRGAAGPGII